MAQEPRQVALLVTAHPDDECMFFTPLILGLQAQGLAVCLLCLSTGPLHGWGRPRSVLFLPREVIRRVTCDCSKNIATPFPHFLVCLQATQRAWGRCGRGSCARPAPSWG